MWQPAKRKLLIFETHPIQYKAPVYQRLSVLCKEEFEVIYASDFSVRAYRDPEFGIDIKWDTPLLCGYPYRVLGNEREFGVASWNGLTGHGVDRLIDELRPAAVMVGTLRYRYSWAVIASALRRRIPIWFSDDTNEDAFERSFAKRLARIVLYRAIYRTFSKVFYVGQLNKEHFLQFGVPEHRMVPALHCAPNPSADLAMAEKDEIRQQLRAVLGADQSTIVVSFFGKLIPKKDPGLLLSALAELDSDLARRVFCLFVGSGPLESNLRELAASVTKSKGLRTCFAGFVNQCNITSYYLASDVVVLPSKRSGETWGLVVNEALQAGCAVAVSEAVGCHRDFGNLERVRTFGVGNARELADAVAELSLFERDFEWASETMRRYSIEAAADSFACAVKEI